MFRNEGESDKSFINRLEDSNRSLRDELKKERQKVSMLREAIEENGNAIGDYLYEIREEARNAAVRLSNMTYVLENVKKLR